MRNIKKVILLPPFSSQVPALGKVTDLANNPSDSSAHCVHPYPAAHLGFYCCAKEDRPTKACILFQHNKTHSNSTPVAILILNGTTYDSRQSFHLVF